MNFDSILTLLSLPSNNMTRNKDLNQSTQSIKLVATRLKKRGKCVSVAYVASHIYVRDGPARIRLC